MKSEQLPEKLLANDFWFGNQKTRGRDFVRTNCAKNPSDPCICKFDKLTDRICENFLVPLVPGGGISKLT